jgi:hypothetical protein
LSKYRAIKTKIDGITFDSKKEAQRYLELRLMANGCTITQLEMQPVYILAPSVVINGRKKPALKYKADFRYNLNGSVVVEDVKGMLTPVYKIKRHLMKSVHGIDIFES